MTLTYIWSKVFKKLAGRSILHSQIASTSKVEAQSHIVHSKIGEFSIISYGTEILYCEIGSFSSIASQVKIGGAMHPMDWVSTSPVFYEGRDSLKTKFSTHSKPPTKKTMIGHDVWVGDNALIKQGVTIGTGAVVGMGSVVTSNVEPYSIVAGNPARLIRMRFDEATCKSLLASKWWELPSEELQACAQYFNQPQIFLEKMGPRPN